MRHSTLWLLLTVGSALIAPACVSDGDTSTMPDGVDQDPDRDPGSGDGSGSGDPSNPPVTRVVLDHDYQVQQTGYWCGPAATRVALSARITPPTQQALANQLPTTTNGTDYIGQVTRTLNDRLGGTHYKTTEMPNDPPTQAQRDRLWNDLVLSIGADYAVVANIVAPPGNQPPGYPSNQTIYHYFAVVGYDSEKREVYIADSANFGGNQHYWLTFDKLATLIPPKGYSSLAAATP
jgi:Peptidase_C39 like family